ncbi:P-loop containing nucleoside triphosphate hydrolase protein [Imleria badia]|nr:P-loop containing nucleoside triphosphate hydrolase protein [Imleria badia]
MKDGSFNVILFGETGAGKSSVVNLLAGKEVARTSPDIDGCTKACHPYSLIVNDVSYTVWDTVGLDEPMIGDTGYLRAIEQACKLVRDLTKAGGVDLLLFCHRQGRITTITQKNYALLYEAACRKSVPIAVVITHLEQEEHMEEWWEQNADIFEQRGVKFCGHACVTTLPDDPKMQESKEAIERILKTVDSHGGYRMATESEVKGKDLVRILRERCGLREHDAYRVAQILAE